MSHPVLDHISTTGKITGEVVALGAIGGTLLDALPYAAAGIAIVWHCLLIYDWAANKLGRRKGDNNNK
jgi:hypothetical protein